MNTVSVVPLVVLRTLLSMSRQAGADMSLPLFTAKQQLRALMKQKLSTVSPESVKEQSRSSRTQPARWQVWSVLSESTRSNYTQQIARLQAVH